MNPEHLNKIMEEIDTELSNSLKEDHGKEIFTKLCFIRGDLGLLISMIKNPEKHEKIKRMCEKE
jgi:hypothetical protein